MAKRRLPWHVAREVDPYPYAFFISHVNEDQEEVSRLKAAVEARSGRGGLRPLACFFDVQNWEIGNQNSMVIREYLLKSAHMVIWATPAYLRSDRGWVWMELAYAELIELSQNADSLDLRHPFVVPVFRDTSVGQVARTPLRTYWQRQLLPAPGDQTLDEVARKLVDFYEQEIRKRPPANG